MSHNPHVQADASGATVEGGMTTALTVVTTDYAVLVDDSIVIVGGPNLTITLPDPDTLPTGRTVIVQNNADASETTVLSSAPINGLPSYTDLIAQWCASQFIACGTFWLVYSVGTPGVNGDGQRGLAFSDPFGNWRGDAYLGTYNSTEVSPGGLDFSLESAADAGVSVGDWLYALTCFDSVTGGQTRLSGFQHSITLGEESAVTLTRTALPAFAAAAGGGWRVYRSGDGGTTWHCVSDDSLGGVPIDPSVDRFVDHIQADPPNEPEPENTVMGISNFGPARFNGDMQGFDANGLVQIFDLLTAASPVLQMYVPIQAQAGLINASGATGGRPSSPSTGQEYFDTTLVKPIWYSGSVWVDAAGTTV